MSLKSKKGFLDIGVNFAVLIIIGLAVLGLLLFFMMRSFNYAENSTPKNVPDIWFHASNENPLQIQSELITIKRGKSAPIMISVFNNRWSDEDNVIIALDECKGTDGESATGFGLSATSQKIVLKTDKGFEVILSSEDSVEAGDYVCTVIAGLQDGNDVDTQFAFHSSQFSVSVS